MDKKIVTIDLGERSYDIYIGPGLIYNLTDLLPVELAGRSIFIITDTNVETYAVQIKNILAESSAQSSAVLTIPAGEASKSFTMVEKVQNWLLGNGVNRDSIIVAIGGGVVGDLAGFCASITLRGVPYIQIPTTLLSQVDSSVGGKTGINTTQGKNLVGSFYQPIAVMADIEALKTLPKREVLAGYAEVVKYGLIGDAGFFAWLEKNGSKVCDIEEESMIHAVERSIKAKAQIVQADETEQGQRALLNLGHTFGHALEAAAGYDGRLLHGEAVAIGTIMAFELSVKMGHCPTEDLERVERHFIEVGLPTRISLVEKAINTTADKLLELMRRDKKVEKGKMKFILANGIGEAFIADDVPENLVHDILSQSVGTQEDTEDSMSGSFKNKGVKGLWRSAFSSRS